MTTEQRKSDPQASLLDRMTDEEVLDMIDPPASKVESLAEIMNRELAVLLEWIDTRLLRLSKALTTDPKRRGWIAAAERENEERTPRSALAAWRARLRSGTLGEDPKNWRTWVLDDLWRAACKEAGESS